MRVEKEKGQKEELNKASESQGERECVCVHVCVCSKDGERESENKGEKMLQRKKTQQQRRNEGAGEMRNAFILFFPWDMFAFFAFDTKQNSFFDKTHKKKAFGINGFHKMWAL